MDIEMDFKRLGIICVFITLGLLGIEYIAYAMHSVEDFSVVHSTETEDNRLLYLALFTATISVVSLLIAYLKEEQTNPQISDPDRTE
ncbi:MAG: hypothetical protein V7739_09900 [Motiliproteus sp.]